MKDFVMISCHNSGTHSIQCLMEIINLKEEEEIIKLSIKESILTLSYVFQKLNLGWKCYSCDAENYCDCR